MTKTNKEKVIKKVRKQADVIGTKLATLQKEATYSYAPTIVVALMFIGAVLIVVLQ